MVGRNEVGITLTAKDLASREIGKVGGSLESLAGQVEGTAGRTGILGRVASGLFNGVFLGAGMYAFGQLRNGFGFVKDSIFGFNNQLQQSGMGFETMLGSGEKAQAFLQELKTFAAKTPFEFPGLITASQRMLAFGFASEEIIPTLTAVGDAAAGLGASQQTIDNIVRAIGQMKAKGKVSGEEMRQLAEAGIPAWDILAKSIGKSTAETMKLAENGLIPADEAITALTEGMGTRFSGLMEKQSHTYQGAMSTIKDVTRDVMGTAFRPFFALVAEGADKFSIFLQSGKAQEWAAKFGEGLQSVIDKVKDVFAWIESAREIIRVFGIGSPTMLKHIESAFEKLTGGVQTFLSQFSLEALIDKFLTFKESAQTALLDLAESLLPKVGEAIQTLADQLPGFLSEMLPKVLKVIERMANGFMDFVGRAVDIIAENAPAIIDAVSNFFQAAFDWIVNVGVPTAAAAIGPLFLKFVDWVFEVLPKLLDVLDDVIAAIIDFVVTNAPVLAGKLVEWAIAFVGFIATEVVPRLLENLPTIIRTILLFIGGNAPKIIGKVGELGHGMLMKLAEWLLKMPGDVALKLAQVVIKVARWADNMLSKAINAAKDFVGGVIQFIKDLPFKVAGFLLEVIGKVAGFAGDLLRKGAEAGSGFVAKIVGFYASLPGKIAKFLSDIVLKVIGWGGDLLRGASKAAGKFISGFVDALGSLPGKIARVVGDAFRKLRIDIGPFHISGSGIRIDLPKIDLPSFAVGAWKLPQDMVAQVHKGEMIVPADIAARLRGEVGAPSSNVPTSSLATVSAGGGTTIHISNYYGPSSVRSSEDIRRISEEQAERIRLLGLGLTVRTTGSIG